jgi:hypothetical protein
MGEMGELAARFDVALDTLELCGYRVFWDGGDNAPSWAVDHPARVVRIGKVATVELTVRVVALEEASVAVEQFCSSQPADIEAAG